jgi:hypothetical protein
VAARHGCWYETKKNAKTRARRAARQRVLNVAHVCETDPIHFLLSHDDIEPPTLLVSYSRFTMVMHEG